MAHVLANERITSPGHSQDTRHIELDLADSGLVYEPGDLLAIMPRQDPQLVTCFLRRCSLDGDAWVGIAPASDVSHSQQVGHSFRRPFAPVWAVLVPASQCLPIGWLHAAFKLPRRLAHQSLVATAVC